jgi:hypothetical protein
MNQNRIIKNRNAIKKIDRCLFFIAKRQYNIFKQKEYFGENGTDHVKDVIKSEEQKLNILEKNYTKLVETL